MTTATTSRTATCPRPVGPQVPPLGGFNLTVRAAGDAAPAAQPAHPDLHLRAAAGLLPALRGRPELRQPDAGNGNVTAFVMISMAIYGAMLATTSGGAMVAIERAAGWSRQLRLTPLRPTAYIAVKLITAMVLGLIRWWSCSRSGGCTGGPDAREAVVRVRGHRLGRLARLRGVRPVHGLPAAERERHADPRPGAGPARLRRRAVRPAEPDGHDLPTSPSSPRCTA